MELECLIINVGEIGSGLLYGKFSRGISEENCNKFESVLPVPREVSAVKKPVTTLTYPVCLGV
jgi:hypothetical protein